jgi:Cytochrome oxidase complex assembly protein 1
MLRRQTKANRSGIVELLKMIGPSLSPDVRSEEVPPGIDRWNWGAFLLTCFWGIFNRTPIALLAILPGFNVIMPFVLGARGSRWAWRNGNWDSVEHFKRVQRKWAMWGCIIYLCGVSPAAALIGFSFYYPYHVLRHSEAFELATSRLQTSAEAASLLGAPITIGTPGGAIMAFGGIEDANFHFSVIGPKAKAQAFTRVTKRDGPWVLQSLELTIDGDKAIQLVKRSDVGIDRDRSKPGSERPN